MGALFRSAPRAAGVGRLGAFTRTLGGMRLLVRGAGAPARFLGLLLALLGLPLQFLRPLPRRLGLGPPALEEARAVERTGGGQRDVEQRGDRGDPLGVQLLLDRDVRGLPDLLRAEWQAEVVAAQYRIGDGDQLHLAAEHPVLDRDQDGVLPAGVVVDLLEASCLLAGVVQDVLAVPA